MNSTDNTEEKKAKQNNYGFEKRDLYLVDPVKRNEQFLPATSLCRNRNGAVGPKKKCSSKYLHFAEVCLNILSYL